MSAIFDHAAAQWREMRAEFDDLVYSTYEQCESAIKGAMVNRRGRSAGIDPLSLFTGPHIRVVAYGSDELLDWFATHGRPSLARFEHDWLRSQEVHP